MGGTWDEGWGEGSRARVEFAYMTRSCTATRSTTMRANTVSPSRLCATNSVTIAVEESVAAAERKTLSTFS